MAAFARPCSTRRIDEGQAQSLIDAAEQLLGSVSSD